MAKTIEDLQEEVVADLTVELQNEDDFDADALAIKVKGAVLNVKQHRNYGASKYTDEEIVEDLYNYYPNILDLARFDYNQIGAEGEKSHTENGLTRTYLNREDFFNGIFPFVKIL